MEKCRHCEPSEWVSEWRPPHPTPMPLPSFGSDQLSRSDNNTENSGVVESRMKWFHNPKVWSFFLLFVKTVSCHWRAERFSLFLEYWKHSFFQKSKNTYSLCVKFALFLICTLRGSPPSLTYTWKYSTCLNKVINDHQEHLYFYLFYFYSCPECRFVSLRKTEINFICHRLYNQ